ncbi:D-alanyl-D-alanine carboxypeptidase [Actinophytocola oryzae]|uniref:D-alanyl-D-alanine carboxypeptidase n=2 Tax=Actinophytocola oryzae TaxID=502181 RepID=A0A4R7UX95_9PSEU|nr:D-alanyl-D-alanine carboxypeptidase [Actinophytocola oryzae]
MSQDFLAARLWSMKTIIAVVAAAALTLGSGATASAAEPPLDPAKLAAAIAGLPNDDASGALLQVRGADGQWQGTSGVANLHTGQRVPIDGRFRIGSMTKSFTATAALQLVAKGRLDLNRTVQSYVPDVLPTSYPPITIDQLLSYTSGLPGSDIDHKDPTWFLAHRFDTWTPQQLFRVSFHNEDGSVKPLHFTPGTMQNYGNIDYLVLGAVIEKVTGRPYGEAIENGVIRPLHLTATTVPGTNTGIHGPHAHGYELRGDGSCVDITDANPTYQWAAAEMISNAPDLDRFLVALMSGRLLPPAQTRLLFEIPDVDVLNPGEGEPTHAYLGHGLASFPTGDLVFWGKTGDRPGYNNGMAATRDLTRRAVFSVNTLHMGGSTQPVTTRKIIAAVAGLA